MKINEKTLIAYSTSTTSPVDKEGWLWKRGEINKNFQKRYFLLKGNLLFYFEKQTDKEPVGVIVIEGCTIELAEEEEEKFAFKIVFHGEGKRTYIIGTETQELLEEWMKTLACASYDYMKLMVTELQQQLSDFEEAERNGVALINLANGSSKDSNPKPPPRQRSNPFNKTSSRRASVLTWQSLHSEFGVKVQSDRSRWILKSKEQKSDSSILQLE